MQAVTPSELVVKDKLRFRPVNWKKVAEEDQNFVVSQLLNGRYPSPVMLRGTLTTANINKSENDEWGVGYSFGMQFHEETDVAALERLIEMAKEVYNQGWEDDEDEPGELEWKPPLKDEVLYIKCKVDKKTRKKFAFTTNIKKLTPDSLPHAEIERYMAVKVKCEVGAFFNLENQTAGLFFTVRHVDFLPQEDPDLETPPLPTTTVTPPGSRPVSPDPIVVNVPAPKGKFGRKQSMAPK